MGIFQQFPYSNFHEFNLDQIIKIMREMQDEWEATKTEWASYKEFIDNYFANLDVSQEVLDALRVLAESGELNTIIDPVIVSETADWLAAHITPTTPIVDDSLTIAGAAADSKTTGNAIKAVKKDLDILADDGYSVIDMSFENGSLNNSTGAPEAHNYRVRSANFCETADVEQILVDRTSIPYVVYVYYYASDFSFVKRTSGQTTDLIDISTDQTYFKIVALNFTDDGYSNPITPEEVTRDIHYVNSSELRYVYTQIPTPLAILQHPESFIASASGNDLQIAFTGSVYIRGKATRGRTFAQLLTEMEITDSYVTIPHGNAWVYDTEDGLNKIVDINTPANVKPSYIIVIAAWWGKIAGGVLAYTAHESETARLYPPYFETQIQSAISRIKSHSGSVGKNGITFSFITDLHWGNNQKYSPYLVNEIAKNTSANMIILGGDYISQYPDSKATAMNIMRECIYAFRNITDYVYPIFGNHDRNSNRTSSSVYMSQAETYAIINKWMRTETGYGNYFNFYIDDLASKTRIICIDTGAQSIDGGIITAEAQTWIQNLINALSSDWHIVIVAHWLFSPTTWNQPLVNGVLTGSYTSSANTLFTSLDAINTDASKPKVEAIITGHVHCDYNDTTSGGIPIIFVDTDSMGAYGEYTATAGTTSEQCFDTITINYNSRKIYCDRVGRGINREISY